MLHCRSNLLLSNTFVCDMDGYKICNALSRNLKPRWLYSPPTTPRVSPHPQLTHHNHNMMQGVAFQKKKSATMNLVEIKCHCCSMVRMASMRRATYFDTSHKRFQI